MLKIYGSGKSRARRTLWMAGELGLQYEHHAYAPRSSETRTPEFLASEDVEPKARAAVADCLVPTEPPAPTIVKRFNHLFSDPVGYAAGYYSYKWAEVLDADAFTRFRREGIFNAAVGGDFVRQVLSRGNSADPAELFRGFMGRDPDVTALLERSGLSAA